MESTLPKQVDGLEIRETGAEVVVHDPNASQVHILNQTAAAVLRMCDGTNDAAAIAKAIAADANVDESIVRPDIDRVLASFRDLKIIT